MSSLSSHLLASHQHAGPSVKMEPQQPFVQCANGSTYNPLAHGSFGNSPGFGRQNASGYIPPFLMDASMSMDDSGVSDATARQIADLQAKLDRKLGPEFISTRAGAGG